MMEKLKVLSLFAGIGGFDLGLERTGGFETVAFCEIDPLCQRILAKHWPGVPIYDDVRTLTADRLAADGIAADVVCGGFPCQDISVAGRQLGIDSGTRSGLWEECSRIVGELRPNYAIFENVSNLLAGPSSRPGAWFGRVLRDLARLRYNAEWFSLPASAVGAPHHRPRIWIIAYPFGSNVEGLDIQKSIGLDPEKPCGWEPSRAVDEAISAHDYTRMRGIYDGVSEAMDALKALGNAIVPQIPELIGRSILDANKFSFAANPSGQETSRRPATAA